MQQHHALLSRKEQMVYDQILQIEAKLVDKGNVKYVLPPRKRAHGVHFCVVDVLNSFVAGVLVSTLQVRSKVSQSGC